MWPNPESLTFCRSGEMADTDIAWAAGLFEGEGSIYIANIRKYSYPRLQLKTTDLDVLIRFHNIIIRGRIYKHKPRDLPSYYKQAHNWQLATKSECLEVIKLFWPYLGKRRRQQAVDCGLAPSDETANIVDLKSTGESLTGSIPVLGISNG